MKYQNDKKNILAQKDKKHKTKMQCSFVTFVLIICIIELVAGAMNNINKNINFSSKIKGLENKKNEELNKNKQLKFEIDNYNSETTLEAIARNNLKMAGKDEILIIINKPTAEIPADITINHQENSKYKTHKY